MSDTDAVLTDGDELADFRQAMANMWSALSTSSLFDPSNASDDGTDSALLQLGYRLDKACSLVSTLLGEWQSLYDDATSRNNP
jgi:hypothetical protein